MPFAGNNRPSMVRVIIGAPVGFDTGSESGRYRVRAGVAVAEQVLRIGAGTHLFLPDKIQSVRKSSRALFKQRSEFNRVGQMGDGLMLIGCEKAKVSPQLAWLRELERVFKLVPEETSRAARSGFVSRNINFRLPPFRERVRNRNFGGISTFEVGACVTVPVAANLNFRLRGEHVWRVNDEIIRPGRFEFEDNKDREQHSRSARLPARQTLRLGSSKDRRSAQGSGSAVEFAARERSFEGVECAPAFARSTPKLSDIKVTR